MRTIDADDVIAKLDKMSYWAKVSGKNKQYNKGIRDAIKLILAEIIIQEHVEDKDEE